MNRPLILVGGGGHCKSVIEAAESAGFTIKGILDFPDTLGCKILGYEVIGSDDDIPKYIETCDFVVTVGFIKDSNLRVKLHKSIEDAGGKFATIIASTAHVSRYSTIGEGSVILHQANVNAGARIGKSVIVNSCANIEHDVVIEDFCHISTGVMINGSCRVAEKSFIGSGTIIANNISIGDNVTIGIGAVVLRDIPSNSFCFGNPAHYNVHNK